MVRKKISRNEESYYVSIKEPLETRRHILESTKKALMSLQNYHKLLNIRKEKLEHIENLRQSIKELSYLNVKLLQKLPDYNVEIMNSFKKSKKVVKSKDSKNKETGSNKTEDVKKAEERKPADKVVDKKIREQSELEKLEAALASIESKIKELG